MPSFTHPWCLLLLVAVPLLVGWWLWQRRGGMRHPGAAMLGDMPTWRSLLATWGGACLRGLGLVLLVIALAGPRWPDLRTRIRTEGIAIVMLLDVSSSMAREDFEWQGQPISRLDAARKVFRLFVAGGQTEGQRFDGRPDDLIGLVSFGTRPDATCPLTLSHSVLLDLLDAEELRSVPGEADTNLSDALTLGLQRLRSAPPKRKVLVLLSDGEQTVVDPRSGWTPRQAAQVAANLGIPIYCIDAGGDLPAGPLAVGGQAPGAVDAAARAAGRQSLQDMAKITEHLGGRYFQANDTRNLLAVCQEIDRREREEIESFQYRRYHEGYPWFGLTALMVFVTLAMLELTVWRRIP